jgi:hypothetical protein
VNGPQHKGRAPAVPGSGQVQSLGRQWIVKRDYGRLWLVVYSVVGLAIMVGILLLIGTR